MEKWRRGSVGMARAAERHGRGAWREVGADRSCVDLGERGGGEQGHGSKRKTRGPCPGGAAGHLHSGGGGAGHDAGQTEGFLLLMDEHKFGPCGPDLVDVCRIRTYELLIYREGEEKTESLRLFSTPAREHHTQWRKCPHDAGTADRPPAAQLLGTVVPARSKLCSEGSLMLLTPGLALCGPIVPQQPRGVGTNPGDHLPNGGDPDCPGPRRPRANPTARLSEYTPLQLCYRTLCFIARFADTDLYRGGGSIFAAWGRGLPSGPRLAQIAHHGPGGGRRYPAPRKIAPC